jgi:putative endonuclease
MWKLKLNPLNKGKQQEDKALLYLQQQGLTLLAQNEAFAGGEIDLIMLDKNQLVFIEVRYRKNSAFGGAAASVSYQKQQKMRNTAGLYLARHYPKQPPACRFDVIAMSGDTAKPDINWIRNAFE